MSVLLTPKNGEEDSCLHISNGEWLAATRAVNAFEPEIPAWNGYHDPHEYTPVQLEIMADRIEQMAHLPEALRELAKNGGAELS